MAIEKIILPIFTGVAILMLLIAGISSVNNIRKLNREESAPGVVTDVKMERSYVNEEDRVVEEFYYPVVEFIASDGRRRNIQMSEGSSPPSYEVGDEVTVLYEPDHPIDARIQSMEQHHSHVDPARDHGDYRYRFSCGGPGRGESDVFSWKHLNHKKISL